MITDDRFRSWVKQLKGDNNTANCTVCFKVIDLGNMGEAALRSHMKSRKHVDALKAQTSSDITLFSSNFVRSKSKTDNPTVDENISTCIGESSESCTNNSDSFVVPLPPPPVHTVAAPHTKSITKFMDSSAVLKAEIMWTLRTVTTHCSYKSNDKVVEVFKYMFPDSEIVKKFTCGERKTA